MANKEPQIFGPGANAIKIIPTPDATGYPGDSTEDSSESAGQPTQTEAAPGQGTPDPAFPFGTPDQLDYTELDIAGVELITELNLRPWIKTTEYCSGHPLDRPPEETSELYPYVTGENVYEELTKLDMAYMRGLISKTYLQYRKQQLREGGATRFYLNVNVYDQEIFQSFIKLVASLVIAATHTVLYPLRVQFSPLRPGPGKNYSIWWDYWNMEERDMIHIIFLTALKSFPV